MKKGRNFQGVIYPDSDSYSCDAVLASGLEYFESFSYILHDQDLNEQGEIKKPHYHWLGQARSPLAVSVVAKRLGVPENAVEFCHSYRKFLRYLAHLDNPDKHQYSIDDIQGNFDKRPLAGDMEKLFMAELMQVIRNHEVHTVEELATYAQLHNAWPEFRRNYSILKDLLYESNNRELNREWSGAPFSE